jgi:glyoxylase I family protein
MVKLSGNVTLLQVFDMPTALAFYRDRLGFQIVAASTEIEAAEGRYSHWMWLRRDETELMLNTAYDANERPPVRDEARWRGHGDTCLYIGCNDTDALWRELVAAGVACAAPHDAPYGMRQLYVADPDCYQLCFRQPAVAR